MGNGWLIGMAESSDYREWTAEGETSLDGELCCMPLSMESFKAWLGKDGICDRKDIVGSRRSQILIFSQIDLLHENWKRNKQK